MNNTEMRVGMRVHTNRYITEGMLFAYINGPNEKRIWCKDNEPGVIERISEDDDESVWMRFDRVHPETSFRVRCDWLSDDRATYTIFWNDGKYENGRLEIKASSLEQAIMDGFIAAYAAWETIYNRKANEVMRANPVNYATGAIMLELHFVDYHIVVSRLIFGYKRAIYNGFAAVTIGGYIEGKE